MTATTTDEFLEFLPLYPAETETAIRARWDAWANEGLDASQVDQWTDTREGAMFNVCTQPGVREAARIYDLMGSEVVAASNPLWAWDTYLDDHAAVQSLARKVAVAAEGYATFSGPPGTLIAPGFTVGKPPASADDDPPEYSVKTGGTIPAAAAAPTGLSVTMQAGGSLVNGTTYRWVITAVDAAGETVASAEVTGAATATNNQALIDWADVPTATSYRVYRRTGAVAGPPWDFLAEVIASTYTDTGAVAPDAARHPPAVNGTGGKLRLAITATTTGSIGNVSAGAITAVITPATGVTVVNSAAVIGGSDVETDPDLRGRLLDKYLGQGAGNVRDYVRWAEEEPGVESVAVIPLWNGPGTVKVVLLGPAGAPTSATTVNNVQTRLDPVPGQGQGEAPIGAIVTVTTATALPITVSANVKFESGYTLDGFGGTIALKAVIEKAVVAYINGVPPGGEVVASQVLGRIVSVRGVHDAAGVLLNGAAVNIAVPSNPARVPITTTPISLTAL